METMTKPDETMGTDMETITKRTEAMSLGYETMIDGSPAMAKLEEFMRVGHSNDDTQECVSYQEDFKS